MLWTRETLTDLVEERRRRERRDELATVARLYPKPALVIPIRPLYTRTRNDETPKDAA